MKSVLFGTMSLIAIFMLSGCSSKTSILVPGQSESDCADKANKLGVCGSPRNIYEHQDRIKQIYYEEGESYRVDNQGRIYNVDSGKEVVPGVKTANESICPGCTDSSGAATLAGPTSGGVSTTGKNGNAVSATTRSLIAETPQKAAVIRDMGWQQKVWVAPHENATGDLVEAHGIYAVIQEPKWIIGEKRPEQIKRGVVVPTPLAAEVLSDNHMAVDRRTQYNIDSYMRTNFDQNYKKISGFVADSAKLSGETKEEKVRFPKNGLPTLNSTTANGVKK